MDTNAHLFQVFLRLRPSSPQSSVSESRFLTTRPGQNHAYVTPPEGKRFRAMEKFAFTQIFNESSSQLEVFSETLLSLVEEAVNGRDGMLATLGVTGSGKTHTILGNKEQKGMIQLALDVLFNSIGDQLLGYEDFDAASSDGTEAIIMDSDAFRDGITYAAEPHSKRTSIYVATPKSPDVSHIAVETDPNSRYGILISMYELYNDRIFDLLDLTTPSTTPARRKALTFKKPSAPHLPSKDQKRVVSGLRKVYVQTLPEALEIIERGQTSRRASPTNSNLTSSRSHAFLQLEIKRFSVSGTEKDSASLHIVDLAGSERARNAKTEGERLVEAGSINRSLMCLGQCLQLQTESENGKPAVVPWRQSKLTELLFCNSFSGSSGQRASMIVTADAMGDFNATSQILRYSALAREITVPRTEIRVSGISDDGVEDSVVISAAETGKDALISRLIEQLEDMEDNWRDAEDRCLLIEQAVREEVAAEMEEQWEGVRREQGEARAKEEEWREGFLDEKLEILRRGIGGLNVDENLPSGALERILELEEENGVLRREMEMLKRQVNNRSPSASKGRKRGKGLGGW
ncbi:hypothetical protein RUND412_002965 [Rhizina undulata]